MSEDYRERQVARDLMVRHSRPRRLSPAEVDDVARLYQGGATVSDLADRYNIHRNTVTAHLERSGIPRRGGAPSSTNPTCHRSPSSTSEATPAPSSPPVTTSTRPPSFAGYAALAYRGDSAKEARGRAHRQPPAQAARPIAQNDARMDVQCVHCMLPLN
jgi:DNA-binding CsgD family transcriptional regulator